MTRIVTHTSAKESNHHNDQEGPGALLPDDSRDDAQPATLQKALVFTDAPIAKIEITTNDYVHVVRSKIVEWLMAGGWFEGMKSSPALMLFSLIHHGRASEHSSGLIVDEHPAVLQAQVGRTRGGFYRSIEALKKAGLIRSWRQPRRNFDTYEVLLPTPPNGKVVGTLSRAGATASAPLSTASAHGALGDEVTSPEQSADSRAGATPSAPCAPTARMARWPAGDTSSCSDDDDGDLKRSSPVAGARKGETADRRRGVELLGSYGVTNADAESIVFDDPKVLIADDKLCEVIQRIARYRPAKYTTSSGGWWRKALREHLRYGADPVVEAIAQAKQRTPDKPLGFYDQLGKQWVTMSTDDELIEAHVVLIEHYRRAGNSDAVKTLEAIDDPRSSADFWRVVGKNPSIVGIDVAAGSRGGQA